MNKRQICSASLYSKNVNPKHIACILSFIGFVIAFWLGSVLGLDGTLWD